MQWKLTLLAAVAAVAAVAAIGVAVWLGAARPPIHPHESLDPDALTDKEEPSRHLWRDECSTLVVRTDCQKPLPSDAWVHPWRDGELEYERYIGRFNICMLGAPARTGLCPPLSRERWERERQAELQSTSDEFQKVLSKLPFTPTNSLVGDFPPYYGSH